MTVFPENVNHPVICRSYYSNYVHLILTHCQCRAQLPRHLNNKEDVFNFNFYKTLLKIIKYHQEWEVPRDDLTTNADRFVASESKIASIHWDGLSMILICPASIVAQDLCGSRNINEERVIERFPVVQSFQTL